jgi:hypothetical protein
MSAETGLPPPEPPESSSDPQQQGRDWHDVSSLAVWGATLFAAVVAAFSTGRQAYLANKQLRVARDGLEVSRDTERRQLRAYVFVAAGSVTLRDRTLTGVVDLKNSGQTPAYDMTTISRLEIRGIGDPFVPGPFSKIPRSIAILGAGVTMNPQAELVIPPETTVILPYLQSGLAVVYMLGQVRYRDIFDQKWVLNFRMRSHNFEGSSWVMEATEGGNNETHEE